MVKGNIYRRHSILAELSGVTGTRIWSTFALPISSLEPAHPMKMLAKLCSALILSSCVSLGNVTLSAEYFSVFVGLRTDPANGWKSLR